MKIPPSTQPLKKIKGLISDNSLTKKATWNAAASGLDYFTRLVIGLIITPLMVTGLGDYFFGVWQIINRLYSYIATTAGPASPLEWTLAKEQSLDNTDEKRRYVGASLVIWAILLPITIIFGSVITWFAPVWLKAAPEYYTRVRIVAGIFILSEAFTSLSFIPYAILRGQNQGYRRIGLSFVLLVFNGFLTWLALQLKTGIVGVTVAATLQAVANGVFYFAILRTYIPWFGILRPPVELVKRFLKLSGWYLAGDVVSNLTFASDVVVLGLLNSVESVTSYTLTKYVPETVISIIAIIVVGIIPGLSGIVGTGDLKKASQVRDEIMSLTWLIVTAIGTTILFWNRPFLELWVGSTRYAGTLTNLLVVIVVFQLVLIRTDGVIIDLTLKIERKVLYGTVSVVLALAISAILVKFYHLGTVGICIGLIVGRLLLSFTYPAIVSRFLGIPLKPQLLGTLRPVVVTALLFSAASLLDVASKNLTLTGIGGWLILILGAGVTVLLVLAVTFFSGLSSSQRGKILERIKAVLDTRGN